MLRLAIALSAISLLAMILIDRAIGPKAEFLNAWSVLERLFGREPSAGLSMVARRIGAVGEFVTVLVANTAIGTLLALLVRFAARLLR